jgi:uncharacterized RDD family membrane protein YckC
MGRGRDPEREGPMTDQPNAGQPQPSSMPPPPVATPGTPGKADLGKRFVAAIIDLVIAVLIGLIPIIGGLIATAYWLVRDGLEFDFMDRRSVGKKLVKLRPLRLDGQPMDVGTSVRRNWMFGIGGIAQFFAMTIIGIVIAIPLVVIALLIGIVEIVLVITDPEGRRSGDKTGETRVVEVDS